MMQNFKKQNCQAEKEEIITKPLVKPRNGWERAFKEMAEQGDDALLFDEVFEEENLEEWK